MVYVTLKIQPKAYQISFEDMLRGVKPEMLMPPTTNKDTHDTRTKLYKHTPDRLLEVVNINDKIQLIEEFVNRYSKLIETEDKTTLYHSFSIPKRSGGLRQIDAPLDELMRALRDLKFLFEKELFANYHTCAFAYVKGRCTIDAVKRHQKNNSRWFLKLDFHNFFGSTTPEFVKNMLKTIFPFSEIYKSERGEKALDTALSLCFLNGGLPQGTPISPTLTNLMMIPIDFAISKAMRNHTPHICYTRYADDMLLSSDISFKWTEAQQEIIDILKEFNAPFELNTKKTRYGSNAGRNWNLGVMLNKDNQITIGHAKKKVFKAMVYQFMTDFINKKPWSLEDTQVFAGQMSYFKMVEPDAINKILQDYTTKFKVSVEETIKKILKNNI